MTQAYKQKYQKVNFIIRSANSNDISQIIAVQLKSLEVLAAQDYQPHQLQVLLASKKCKRGRFEIIFVAAIEQQIIGFAALDRFTNSLTGLFIDPEYTRQGIGTKLLQRIEQEAIKFKIPILWVCASLTGYPFYLANSYQELGKIGINLHGVTIPCIQMKKRLLTPTVKQQIGDILYHAVMCLLIVWLLILMIVKF
jgi:putative acetyltransferase